VVSACVADRTRGDNWAAIRNRLGFVESKSRDLREYRGYTVVVVERQVELDLNPHPLRAEGAAPKIRREL
jgi:hypothetical protein